VVNQSFYIMIQKLIVIITLSAISVIILSSCSLYQIDVQQGNVVTQEMLDQLELNMPAKKVRFVMGSPLLIDVFSPQRWDYFYGFQQGNGQREQRHLALFFDEKEQLIKIAGDVVINLRDKQKSPLPPVPEESEPIL